MWDPGRAAPTEGIWDLLGRLGGQELSLCVSGLPDEQELVAIIIDKYYYQYH